MLKIQIEGLPAWSEQAFGVLIAVSIGLLSALGVQMILVPRLRRKLQGKYIHMKGGQITLHIHVSAFKLS